jgi:hypothetical protein
VVAYACRITKENFGAIASEKPDFDEEYTLRWLDDHGTGYFLRDPSSALDCQYFDDDVFFEIYIFQSKDEGELFRRCIKI